MRFGIVMDPIADIKYQKDTSFAMLLEAQTRGHECYYMEPQDLWLQGGLAWGRMQRLMVYDDQDCWYTLKEAEAQPLVDLDLLLMRKDPPFNVDYIYLTYLLEQAEAKGLPVINKPASLRDANEKLFTAWFPQCCPNTLVSSNIELIRDFIFAEEEAVVKPLDSMGGGSIFRVSDHDPNLSVILETMTQHGARLVMVQKFIPAIKEGDKRIIMINGEPIPYALARIPAEGDFRGNLAAGAMPEGRELTDHDRWITEQVGPTLKQKGLLFAGLDVIGDYLTEINVTSPTGVRELDQLFDINIAAEFWDMLEAIVPISVTHDNASLD